MSVIDGRAVLGTGVLQFRSQATGDAGSAPQVQFRADKEGPLSSTSARFEGVQFTVLFNITQGSTATGFYDYTAEGMTYIINYAVQRFADHSDGPFYEARYTVALK